MNLEFRAECYNLLNSPVYQVPGYATVSGSQVRLADASGVIQPGQAVHGCGRGRQFRRADADGVQYGGLRDQPAIPVGPAFCFLIYSD